IGLDGGGGQAACRGAGEQDLSVAGRKRRRVALGARALEDHEGRSLILLQQEITRQWQDVVYAKAAADRSLAIAEGVPGKSQAGFKVAERGVFVIRADAVATRTSL